jgi:hypothetical protein
MASLGFMMLCKLQFSHVSYSDFKEECSILCLADRDAAFAACNYDSAINLYLAVINVNSASDAIFANCRKAKLRKKLWTEALLNTQKVH